MWAGILSGHFRQIVDGRGDDGGAVRVWSRVAGTLEPDCFRDVTPALIEWRS
jgi:hypothetical protein